MHSPYQKRLDTNYVPSIDEAIQIREILDNYTREISELDAQAAILQQQLDVLQAKRGKLHAFSEQHRALLSPMRKLTRDILEEIFLACLPADRNPCMSAVEAPMLLTRVCSSWRQIAHSTPRIWAKIHIVIPITTTVGEFAVEQDFIAEESILRRTLKLREEAVIEWLNRSYACPLSISVFQANAWDNPELANRYFSTFEELQQLYLSLIRNTIIPHHQRWRDLNISVVGNTLQGFLGLKPNLKMLESLRITYREGFRLNTSMLPQYQWKDVVSLLSPCTTSATIRFFPIRQSDMASIPLQSWGNLTELNLKLACELFSGVNGIKFASSILSRCHALITLKIDLFAFHNDSFGYNDSIILRHLTTLSIVQPLNSYSLTFAKLLYLPSLQNLDVDLPYDLNQAFPGATLDTVTGGDIIKSLLRTSEDLHALKLYAPHWVRSTDDLVQILKCLPEIRSLKVTPKPIKHGKWLQSLPGHGEPRNNHLHVINDNLLRALMPTEKMDSAEIICPRLEEFECDYNLVTGISESCLKEFVVSRQSDDRVSSLRRISVFINQPKQHGATNAEKVSLGTDSAVYFRRLSPISYSPFDGLGDTTAFQSSRIATLPSDCYNEL